MSTEEENRRKMDEQGEGKIGEPALGYPAPRVQHPHPQAGPTYFSVPPPYAAGTYPSDVSAPYPPPASVAYPPGDAASTPPPVQPPYPAGPPYYAQGYQTYPGNGAAAAEITSSKIDRLPCLGLGYGWFLFIIGLFMAAIPWYVGAFILIFIGADDREKRGYIACTIGAGFSAVSTFLYLMSPVFGW